MLGGRTCGSGPARVTAPRATCTPAAAAARRSARIPGRICAAPDPAGRSHQQLVEELAEETLQRALAQPTGRQLIIAIAGAPGSGKSTTAVRVAARINQLAAARQLGRGDYAVVVPMDGYHYYRSQLDVMPDPQEAHARRGAEWTFNAQAFVWTVLHIRNNNRASVPSFDHVVGDPVEDDIQVTPDHKVILLEGNYLLLPDEPWCRLRELVDDTWFVDVDIDLAMDRVFRRQTQEVGLAPEVSRQRITANDRPNAEQVIESRRAARLLIPNADAPGFAADG